MSAIPEPVVELATPVAPPWTLDELTGQLIEAHRERRTLPADRVSSAVRTTDEAYRVQARLCAALWPGVDATVWKAGADSRETMPTAAPIVPAVVFDDDATLSAAAFPVRIVEAEIAYRFGIDLPPRDLPYTTDEVHDAIATMHVAIEVVTPRIADFQQATPTARLADLGLNGAFVLGDGIGNWRKVDLRRQKATLSIGGKLVEACEGSHALGNPAVLLPWFVAHLGRLPTWDADGERGSPRGVKAGDVVTTGSWTRIAEARAGQRVEVRFEEIGTASLMFTA